MKLFRRERHHDTCECEIACIHKDFPVVRFLDTGIEDYYWIICMVSWLPIHFCEMLEIPNDAAIVFWIQTHGTTVFSLCCSTKNAGITVGRLATKRGSGNNGRSLRLAVRAQADPTEVEQLKNIHDNITLEEVSANGPIAWSAAISICYFPIRRLPLGQGTEFYEAGKPTF